MMGGLQNEMRKQALLAMKGEGRPRLATVTSFDPSAWAAKVSIQPEVVETGWLPIATPWVGSGWGLFAPPTQGDQVLVLYQEGHVEAGLILGGFFSDQDRPLPAPAGEFWLVHQSGASLRLTNDGALTLSDGQGASVEVRGGAITSAGPWMHTGELTVDGQVNLGGSNPPQPVQLANGQPSTQVKAL